MKTSNNRVETLEKTRQQQHSQATPVAAPLWPGAGDKGGVGGFRGVLAFEPRGEQAAFEAF